MCALKIIDFLFTWWVVWVQNLTQKYEDTFFNALLNKEENTSILTYENTKPQI